MSRKFFPFVFVFLVAAPLSLVISAVTTLIRIGFNMEFWQHWPFAWALGFGLAYPTALIFVPIARKIVERIPWKD